MSIVLSEVLLTGIVSCKEQRLELTKLQMQKVSLKALVDNFQDNIEQYPKIRKTVGEKVTDKSCTIALDKVEEEEEEVVVVVVVGALAIGFTFDSTVLFEQVADSF